MSKFKINSVRDSKTERKFTFRIRDMYEKYTFEATAKAKDVLEAKQKIKAKLIGWGNMMIMHVEDELGNQYFGNKLYNFKDEDTTEEVIKKTEFAEKVNDRNAYENMNDRCYAATTPQGYSIIETYVDDDNKIYIIAKRPEDYMIAEDYQVSDGTWKKSTNGFASISLAQDELKKSIKNVTRIFDAGLNTEEMARREIEKIKSQIAQKEYALKSYEKYDLQYGSAKSSDKTKQQLSQELNELRRKYADLMSKWEYVLKDSLECDKDGENCAKIGAVLNGGINVGDFAFERQDAIDRCVRLGKQFIQHFDKIYKNPDSQDINHWKSEMNSWLKSAKEIKLKNSNKPLLNSELHDWFFTAGAYPRDFIKNPSQDELEAYDKFTTKVLAGGTIDSLLPIKDAAITDSPIPTKAVGMDKIIYTMQSDVDPNLYFYIGKVYSMKEGEWTYQKFSMLGTSPEELKFDLKAYGWHEVDNGPARVIDNKIYAPIVDSVDIKKADEIIKKYGGNPTGGVMGLQRTRFVNADEIEDKFGMVMDLFNAGFKTFLLNGKTYRVMINDGESFSVGDRVLHVVQETKGTVEKVLPNGNIYVKWDSYIKAPNGQTFTAGEEDPKITKIIKMKDAEYWKWVPAYSINTGDWIIPKSERQIQANMPDKGIHWWKVIDISQRNPQSNTLSFTLQDIMNARLKVDIPEDEKVMLSKTAVHDKEPIDYNAQEAESILRRGVSAENSAIDEYEPWIMRLKELYNETGEEKYLEAAKAIEDIDNEEKKHVGEFSQALTNFSPEEGKLAVEGMEEVKAETKQEDARPLDTYVIRSYAGKREIDAKNEEEAVKKYQAMFPDVSTDEMTISKVKRIESWNYGAKLASENRDCDVKDGWSGIRENGVIYSFNNGQYTITHKNGTVETFPEDKFKTAEELYKYVDNIKDSISVEQIKNKNDLVDFIASQTGVRLENNPNYTLNNKRNTLYTKIAEKDKIAVLSLLKKYGFFVNEHVNGNYWISIKPDDSFQDTKPEDLVAGDVVEETTDPKESKLVEKPQPIKDGFDENKLNAWLRALEKRMVEKYPNNELLHYKYRANYGPKYIKIIQQDDTGKKDVSVFAFADYDGNIYKAAGWNVPAKGVRATLDNPPLELGALYKRF